jgi:hypothetical protein
MILRLLPIVNTQKCYRFSIVGRILEVSRPSIVVWVVVPDDSKVCA